MLITGRKRSFIRKSSCSTRTIETCTIARLLGKRPEYGDAGVPRRGVNRGFNPIERPTAASRRTTQPHPLEDQDYRQW